MLLGPKIIRQCSKCKNLVQQVTLMSGNTFGAKYFTDGKMEAPMLPDLSDLVRCPHCNYLIWIKRQKKLGDEYTVDRDILVRSRAYIQPTFYDYTNYLVRSKLKSKTEKYIRIKAWWAANDSRRNNKKDNPLSKKEIENLQALLKFFNDDDQNDCLFKAEVYRELGEYSKSLYSLNRLIFEDISETVFLIRELALKSNSCVKEIVYK